MKSSPILFITGTDTGVGKTLLTALLLRHLRWRGVRALASKPFCSGGMGDVRLLQSLQPGELGNAEMNPYYFEKPVAPLVEANEKGREIRLKQVVKHLKKLALRAEILLVEGSGGLMVPLGKNFMVIDLVKALDCEVMVVARNKLGTINHTLLTLKALKTLGIPATRQRVVMMGCGKQDTSAGSNLEMISKHAPKIPVFELPFLGKKVMNRKKITTLEKKLEETLRQIMP